jgi:hypothetical protein
MSFYQEYKTLVEPLLGRTLTPADGCAVRPALRIPTALADYYGAVGAIDMINRPHNRLLDPSVLQVEDGMVIFYEENQCVAYWAIREADLHLPDPTVYQGHDTTAGLEWHSENMTVSKWFPVMTYWQIVNQGFQFGGYAARVEDAERAVSAHYPFLIAHAIDSIRFYGVDSQIVCLAPSGATAAVWAAGRTEKDFRHLASLFAFEWDYSILDEL